MPTQPSSDLQLYTALDSAKIVETVERLTRRIYERFPDSGLYQVSLQLLAQAHQSQERAAYIARPMHWIRLIIGLLIAVVILGFVATIWALTTADIAIQGFSFFEFIQTVEAGINDIIFLGAGIFFLVTVEVRIKRNRALKALNELRAIAHVIDMHQLTKDPEYVLPRGSTTASSPQRVMTGYELGRYLDYCSEMLSLAGKLAALYTQRFDDGVVLDSVNEIESLTTGLSRKIWQKLMILHSFNHDATPNERGTEVDDDGDGIEPQTAV
ncbi:MAG: hypothetical protein KDE31_19620 [Caldilineaceae bacterium]|nr:hypothetical protein [Caldilineaceae bacterium]